ncbi:MAG: hypothetical protein P8Y44_11275, partial [Acidobacteriota bacterium]
VAENTSSGGFVTDADSFVLRQAPVVECDKPSMFIHDPEGSISRVCEVDGGSDRRFDQFVQLNLLDDRRHSCDYSQSVVAILGGFDHAFTLGAVPPRRIAAVETNMLML